MMASNTTLTSNVRLLKQVLREINDSGDLEFRAREHLRSELLHAVAVTIAEHRHILQGQKKARRLTIAGGYHRG